MLAEEKLTRDGETITIGLPSRVRFWTLLGSLGGQPLMSTVDTYARSQVYAIANDGSVERRGPSYDGSYASVRLVPSTGHVIIAATNRTTLRNRYIVFHGLTGAGVGNYRDRRDGAGIVPEPEAGDLAAIEALRGETKSAHLATSTDGSRVVTVETSEQGKPTTTIVVSRADGDHAVLRSFVSTARWR